MAPLADACCHHARSAVPTASVKSVVPVETRPARDSFSPVNLDIRVQIAYLGTNGVSNVERSENNERTDPGVSVRVCD